VKADRIRNPESKGEWMQGEKRPQSLRAGLIRCFVGGWMGGWGVACDEVSVRSTSWEMEPMREDGERSSQKTATCSFATVWSAGPAESSVRLVRVQSVSHRSLITAVQWLVKRRMLRGKPSMKKFCEQLSANERGGTQGIQIGPESRRNKSHHR
jgi:hypothetical protein